MEAVTLDPALSSRSNGSASARCSRPASCIVAGRSSRRPPASAMPNVWVSSAAATSSCAQRRRQAGAGSGRRSRHERRVVEPFGQGPEAVDLDHHRDRIAARPAQPAVDPVGSGRRGSRSRRSGLVRRPGRGLGRPAVGATRIAAARHERDQSAHQPRRHARPSAQKQRHQRVVRPRGQHERADPGRGPRVEEDAARTDGVGRGQLVDSRLTGTLAVAGVTVPLMATSAAKSNNCGSSRCDGRTCVRAEAIFCRRPGASPLPLVEHRLDLLPLQPVLAAAEVARDDRIAHRRAAKRAQSSSATWASGRSSKRSPSSFRSFGGIVASLAAVEEVQEERLEDVVAVVAEDHRRCSLPRARSGRGCRGAAASRARNRCGPAGTLSITIE